VRAESLSLDFLDIVEADVPELTTVMTRAFDAEAQRHLGVERGGPEGYDDGEFFRKWLFGYRESVGYKIVSGGQLIGAFILWIRRGGHYRLGTIFVDPAHQDRGVGTRAWQFIEATYPEARTWRLETPVWATKNHHFYENKCGFQRAGSSPDGDSVIYKKRIW